MLNWKAVLAGAIVNFAGTYLSFFVLVLLWMAALKMGAVSDEAAQDAVEHNALLSAVSAVAGWYFDFLGGKVAALLARRQAVLHGLVSALPGVVLAMFDAFHSEDIRFPIWLIAACCVVSLACACYGGASALKSKQPETG
jgi:hypothetical protein